MTEKKVNGEWGEYVNRSNGNDRIQARQVEHFTAGIAYEAVAADGEHLGYFNVGAFDAIYAPAPEGVESGLEDDPETGSEDA